MQSISAWRVLSQADSMETGIIGNYHWAQFGGKDPELSVGATVRALAEYLAGLRAVNVSWDSGRLEPSQAQFASGWQVHCGYAITPVIDAKLTDSWPENTCTDSVFDEWYFFKDVPAQFRLDAYCNWYMNSISEWRNLVDCQPNNIDLRSQLETYKPEVVIGQSDSFIFVIARDPTIIRVFGTLSQRS